MIIRGKRNTNFTIMSNVGLEDPRLSLKAKGILAYLLSKPDDWKVSDRQLAGIGPDGRSAVQSALKELETHGYLKRERVHKQDGTWDCLSYVYDEPRPDYPATDKPWSDKPWLEKPATDKPATENPAILSTVLPNTVLPNTVVAAAAAAAATQPQPSPVFEAWTANMPGTLTPVLVDSLTELESEYSEHEILHAIRIAVERNNRTLGYVRGVLRRGVDSAPPAPTPTRTFKTRAEENDEVFARLRERLEKHGRIESA